MVNLQSRTSDRNNETHQNKIENSILINQLLKAKNKKNIQLKKINSSRTRLVAHATS